MLIFAIIFFIHLNFLKYFIREYEYNDMVNNNLNDKHSRYFASLCENRTREDVVECVMNATTPIYYYTSEEHDLRTPTEYVNKGGDCRDSAVFYATIFKNLNYKTDFIFPVPHHVSLTIKKQINKTTNQYCNIEANRAKCYLVIYGEPK